MTSNDGKERDWWGQPYLFALQGEDIDTVKCKVPQKK